MDPLFAAGTALVVSLALIPVMTRLAPQLGLLDEPNARKVHARPIPRVGGWGISLGALAALLLWLPLAPLPIAFLFGGLVLTVAGAADDIHELPGRMKLAFQFLAALPVVFYGGLAVETLPLGASIEVPYMLGLSLTTLGLVVCINATNTSDGLDGLAAGSTLLSLFGILYLAFTMGATQVLLVTAATVGGLVGFLRYNAHPAIIFMGDLGSQFLGFAIGFLGLALLRTEVGEVSPFALLLIIGLPAADILVVAVRRMIAGNSLFRADKTHIHHRFLELGLSHTQSVVVFYALQGSFVFFGVAFHDSNTWQILLLFTLHLLVIYGALSFAERLQADGRFRLASSTIAGSKEGLPRQFLLSLPRVGLEILVPMLLIAGAALADTIPLDFGVLGLLILLLMVIKGIFPRLQPSSVTRVAVFLAASAVTYVYTNNRPSESIFAYGAEISIISVLGLMAFVAVRFSPKRRKEEFRTTSMDHLMVVFAILAVVALRTIPSAFHPFYLLYLPIVLYCSELLVIERRQRKNWLPPATMAAAAILAVRGILFAS